MRAWSWSGNFRIGVDGGNFDNEIGYILYVTVIYSSSPSIELVNGRIDQKQGGKELFTYEAFFLAKSFILD